MLRVGKIKESVYQRSVMKQVHNEKKLSPFLTQTVSVEGWTMAAERVVYQLLNAFFISKGSLSQITVSVTMPEGTDEPVFRQFVARLGQLCKEEGIFVSIGEAKVVKQISLVEISAVGIGPGENQEEAKKLKEVHDVVVIGTVGREGAAILAREYEEDLKKRFAGFYVDIAKELYDAAAMPAVRDVILDVAWGTAVRDGGIFAGLWQLAAACKVGLDIDLGAIPIRQHTIEVCEFFNLNPYMLLSGGCFLVATTQGQRMVAHFNEMGIQAAIIGKTTTNNDKIIRYDDEIRYLEPPKADEIYLMNR